MARQIPMRLAVGAFILNSGLSKRSADDTTAQELHGFATTTYPVVGKLTPQQFVKALSTGELVVGSALVLPVVPAELAGVGAHRVRRRPARALSANARHASEGQPASDEAGNRAGQGQLVARRRSVSYRRRGDGRW